MTKVKILENNRMFEGYQLVCSHQSKSTLTEMKFSIYIPDSRKQLPVLYFLSGLTCTEQNFIQKSGMQKYASKHKIIVVAPDTSPRGKKIKDHSNNFIGQGAGFYLNASTFGWNKNYKMYDYIIKELPKLINSNFNIANLKQGIMGHSMGGMGALVCAINNIDKFKSLSVLAPICDPINSNFSYQAFNKYLGSNKRLWKKYSPLELFKNDTFPGKILIDQGEKDAFINQLFYKEFLSICKKSKQKIKFRFHKNHGHGYYFISTFIKDHIVHHSKILNR